MNTAHVFKHHPPQPDQLPKYAALRAAAKAFADAIIELTPVCADQSAALRHVREAVMTANAAIALGGSLIGPVEDATGSCVAGGAAAP